MWSACSLNFPKIVRYCINLFRQDLSHKKTFKHTTLHHTANCYTRQVNNIENNYLRLEIAALSFKNWLSWTWTNVSLAYMKHVLLCMHWSLLSDDYFVELDLSSSCLFSSGTFRTDNQIQARLLSLGRLRVKVSCVKAKPRCYIGACPWLPKLGCAMTKP